MQATAMPAAWILLRSLITKDTKAYKARHLQSCDPLRPLLLDLYRHSFALLQLYRNLNKGQRCAAECFVFAKDQCQVTTDGSVRNRYRRQRSRLYVFNYVGTGNEAHAHIGGYKALEQFAGIQFHGYFGPKPALVKQIFQVVTRASYLGEQQRRLRHICD